MLRQQRLYLLGKLIYQYGLLIGNIGVLIYLKGIIYMAKILVVDDDPDILYVVGTLLVLNGHAVQLTLNGEETIEYAKAFVPHVILLDVILGGVDGREICKQVKSDEILADTPVILFSAMEALKDEPPPYSDDFLAKPFCVTELIEKIEKHIKVA